jgi:Acyl-CoA dehydrogenase, C-terminal domain
VTVDAGLTVDAAERELLADSLRRTMTAASGQVLDLALVELGWPELLAAFPGVAVPLAFGLLGETGAHAPLLNDVLLHAAGQRAGGTVPMPYAGGSWVVWDRRDLGGQALDGELPLRPCPAPSSLSMDPLVLAAGRRALGWWLTGLGRAMLTLARSHALDRVQFGRPIASFQAVRHRLAETLVALDGAEATLLAASDEAGGIGSMLAKGAAGHAALTAARHCQQVLGGIGFTAEHGLHRHVRRALVLDGLLGSARELTREAGLLLRREGRAPRLADLVT